MYFILTFNLFVSFNPPKRHSLYIFAYEGRIVATIVLFLVSDFVNIGRLLTALSADVAMLLKTFCDQLLRSVVEKKVDD